VGTKRTKHAGGRPKKPGPRIKMLIVLPRATRERLEAQAAHEGRPMSDIVATAIDRYARRKAGKR
jgi:hypothetical protein